MAIRVLIINRQLVFAVTLKQALEQTGSFDVHPFTTADAAFDFLRDHPQDVALVDFTLPGRSGAKMIQQLRGIQGDLAVIISPRQSNADEVARSLNLQAMIDMPFGARDIIPLIERAVEQFQQNPTGFDESNVADESAPTVSEDRAVPGGQTRILGEDNTSQKQFGTTSLLGNEPAARDEIFDPPAQTRNLGDAPVSPAAMVYPAQTHDLGDDGGSSPYQTRDLEDQDSSVPPPASSHPARTRDLDMKDDEAPPPSRRRSSVPTRDFDTPTDPPEPPEISSLENVLKSFGFDPPIGEEDTPAVPISDNVALRQFLATGDNSVGGGNFDDVLGAIDPQQVEEPPRRESDFDALVKSMKSGDVQRGLPDRQQQLLDFVLTSGMDSVLQEIEKTKTGPLSEATPPPSTLPEAPREKGLKGFQKLAKEEPPMPALEEGGTVSDLMLGVSDRGFRNVLSLLRGDEFDEHAPSEPNTSSRLERHDRFSDFFNSPGNPQTLPEASELAPLRSRVSESSEPSADSFNFDDVPDADAEATVAQVILRAALEELDLPEGFSLNQLLTDIENRLSIHKLNVKPLPSWLMDTSAFRPVTEAEIREPDFLPEQLPPGEEVNLEAALEFEEPENFTGHTTRPSLTNQQALAGFPVEEDTLFDADFIQETLAPQIVPVEAAPAPTEADIEELPDWPEAEMSEGISDFFVQPPEEALFEPEIETDKVPMDQFAEDTQSSNVFTSDESAVPEAETLLSDEAWDINIQPEAADGDVWEEPVVEAEAAVYSEEQSEFAEALDAWSIDLDTQEAANQWGVQPEEPLYEAEQTYEDEYAEAAPAELSWDLPTDIENEDTAAQAIPEDPYIAQLALNLTQFSLESSSEGTLLTRGDEVVAYAGHLSNEDAGELRDAVNNDWDANSDGARIRFITLPSSGKDYMLYSIRTENGFTLSMIFAGTTPLRVIRQQGHKLIAALESIPETQIEEMAASVPEPVEVVESSLVPVETPIDEAILNVYTYVWLLHEPEGRLSDAVAHAMMSGLKTQLRELGWGIRTLQVHEDFVYLYAGVPGENPPHEIMRDLKRRSAEIAHAQNPEITPQMLWADAYLILTPGRELETEEILEFVNFQRMA
jgi:DNA-binding response OmpR family regulator